MSDGADDRGESFWELLQRFGRVVAGTGAAVVDNLAPGVPEEYVRSRLGEIGMEPSTQLLTWWRWQNGLADHQRPGGGAGMLVAWRPLSVDEAVADWRHWDKGNEVWHWAPTWLSIGTPDGMPRLVADCTPPQRDTCTVMQVSPDAGLFHEPDLQSRSRTLEQAVRIWLEAVERGWFQYVPPDGHQNGGWDWPDYTDIPWEYRRTRII